MNSNNIDEQDFNHLFKYNHKGTCLFIGPQNFDKNTVPVMVNHKIMNLKMGMDEDSDIYFELNNSIIYFKDLK